MKESIEPRRFRDLLRLLAEQRRLHERLVKLGQAKLDAIKRADTESMRELNGEEREVVRRVHKREGLRRQLMDVIGESLGLPPRTARALPVSQLSSRVPEPQRALLQEAAGKLRETIGRVAKVNRMTGAVSRGVLGHLGWVLKAVSPGREDPAGYCGDGAPMAGSATQIFETVG